MMSVSKLQVLRVLHIAPSRPFGGLQRQVAWLAGEQRRQGLESSVLGLYEDEAFAADLEKEKVPFRFTRGKEFNLRGCVDLVALLRKEQYDLVHLHAGLLWSNLLIA